MEYDRSSIFGILSRLRRLPIFSKEKVWLWNLHQLENKGEIMKRLYQPPRGTAEAIIKADTIIIRELIDKKFRRAYRLGYEDGLKSKYIGDDEGTNIKFVCADCLEKEKQSFWKHCPNCGKLMERRRLK